MNCPDAREGFSALFRGGMGLTELALLGAHARQCVDCRAARESVQEMLPSRLGPTTLAVWFTRLRVLLSLSLIEAGRASVRVTAASRVGPLWVLNLLSRVRWRHTLLLMTPVFLWPRQRPDNLMPRPSKGEPLSEDVRPPSDCQPTDVAPLGR